MYNINNPSDNFKFFYSAFSPDKYGGSMGRAAEQAVVIYDVLSMEEKEFITEWFLKLFAQESDYYGIPYLQVVEKTKDKRFVPYIKAYYKRLQKRHNKDVEATINGHLVRAKSDFDKELMMCKYVIKKLK